MPIVFDKLETVLKGLERRTYVLEIGLFSQQIIRLHSYTVYPVRTQNASFRINFIAYSSMQLSNYTLTVLWAGAVEYVDCTRWIRHSNKFS